MNNTAMAVGMVLVSGFLAAVSQVLLKVSANREVKQWIWRYLNYHVISSYSILLFTFVMNAFAMRFIPYKLVPVLSSSSYLFVGILSRMQFKETLSWRRLLGMTFILLGIFLFSF